MFGRPHWALSRILKTSVVTASITVLAVFCIPQSAFATNLGTLQVVGVDGATMHQGDTVTRDNFTSLTNFWSFTFSWPYSVPNARAGLAVFRGTFGNLEGGTPVSGVNYGLQVQAWGGSTTTIVKQYGLPMLGDVGTPSGTYTAVVADIATAPDMYNKFVEWFATGGAQGFEPNHYSLLTFTYNATSNPTALPGALATVQYGQQIITEGADVLQETVTPNVNNPSQFWRFNFTWPNAVTNQNALLFVFRGTYGALDGGAPVAGTNYSATQQAWAAGNNNLGKFMSLPGLETEGMEGTYTVMVAERDTKNSGGSAQEALWFSSGGTQGYAPRKYSLLTFTLTNPPKCCSSVLFLPGLKGSKLVYGSDTLWPPSIGSFANDVGQLALNADGTSINDIKVDGVLEVFYTTPIYSGFTSYLDGLVAADTIKDWEPLPYDWRLSPKRIVEDGVELQSGILNLADEVERLASESYSEKVMIVAHSYGGLVAKRLIAELEGRGKSALVESLVLVGSPQLGTPQAAASMLHGAGESIGLGYIVNPVTSRQVALNMESAYHLLPSQLYFDRVAEPVVTFDPSSGFTDEWRTFWGPGISNYVNFFGFVTGADVLRTDPGPQSLRIPEIVSSALLTNADAYHSTYDSYVYPPNINVVQIAGWGLPTVKSIDYRTEHFLQSYRTKTTIEGDNTVVYPSAVNLGGASHYFNLDLYNDLPGLPEYQHRDLLNAAPTQAVVQSILTEGLVYPTIYITNTKPEPTNVADKLMVSTFSPVILGAYDLHGRFTGVDPSQDLNSDLLSIKQEIPGSYFLEDGDSYSIYLPSTGEYSFVVKGLDSGPASIEVSTFSEASTTLAALFKDFAVSDTFTGTFTVDTATPREVQLTADTDGDGETDVVQDSDLKKKPLTVLARNKTMTLGANVPDLDVELMGFVGTDTVANSVTGVASCTTTAVSMSPAGAYPITCTIGTLESSNYEFVEFVDGVLSIGYGFRGFLKPINDPATNPSVFKAGSTVPVKFQILNAHGVSVQSPTAPEWLNPVKGDPLTSPRNEKKRKRKPSIGEVYQWKPKAEHYQYNWDTKGYEPGYWYEVSAKLDDGTIKSVMIGLK